LRSERPAPTVPLSLSCLPSATAFFFYCSAPHRHLHSFPTRRSSDLGSARSTRSISRAPCSLRACRSPASSTPALPSPPTIRCGRDRKSTRLNSSHVSISYAVFCLKKKKKISDITHEIDCDSPKRNGP